eukprot:gnl/Carplike_NY0171/2973_a4000_454.p1 GENE.gnl/Carplike_NY0171/2973_a4000_454~~gnl/Carplike_NY0171/2973_a4000_454.p1  ORF type:complete len:469 (-),score=93.05 gnl/Carplike_NY0171/2973_a4000_454:468-1805(-)
MTTTVLKSNPSKSSPKSFEEGLLLFSRYSFKEELGRGAYGVVYKAFDKRTKQYVAIKKVKAFGSTTRDAQKIFREIYLLKTFKHYNIVKLLNVVKADNETDVYLVFEYMAADLRAVCKARILESIHIQYVMFQLVATLAYLHSGDVIHRDIKPANILIDSCCACKLADFGLARSIAKDSRDEFSDKEIMTDHIATRWYRAPEILVSAPQYGPSVDMWSLGCTFAELLLGRALFPGSSNINQLTRIVKMIGLPFEREIADFEAPRAKEILISIGCDLKQRVPTRTVTIPEIASCPALKARFAKSAPLASTFSKLARLIPDVPSSAIDFLARLLKYSPKDRMTALDALHHPFIASFARGEGSPGRDVMSFPVAPVPLLLKPVLLPLCERIQYPISQYRELVYSLSKRASDVILHSPKKRGGKSKGSSLSKSGSYSRVDSISFEGSMK